MTSSVGSTKKQILTREDCGKKYDVSRFKAGKRFRCKDCRAILTVPSPPSPSGVNTNQARRSSIAEDVHVRSTCASWSLVAAWPALTARAGARFPLITPRPQLARQSSAPRTPTTPRRRCSAVRGARRSMSWHATNQGKRSCAWGARRSWSCPATINPADMGRRRRRGIAPIQARLFSARP